VIGAATATATSNAEPPTCIQPPDPPKPAPPPPPPIVLKVPKLIHFALDKSNISPNSARILDEMAAVLKANPSIIIDIEGHTDSRASDAYNLALGKRRALSARNYLLKQGVDPARMTIRSFGERQLISPDKTKVDFARDRRVEIQYKDINNIEVIVQETDLQIEP
jgi:outer membrane protein OmpA-like peptidoglycan-associated protein